MRVKDIGESQLCSIVFMTSFHFAQLDSLLSSTDVKGFPIVTSDGALTLVGYIERNEIRHVLGELLYSQLKLVTKSSNQSVLEKIAVDWGIYLAYLMPDIKIMME